MPLHPRLARILIDGRAAPEVAAACASLSERPTAGPRHHQMAEELRRLAGGTLGTHVSARATDAELRHALFTGYADRLARRRAGARDRFLLATGHGATLVQAADAPDAEFIVALEIMAGAREGISEAKIRMASAVDREWIRPTSTQVEHRFDASGRVRAARVERYEAIVLTETPVAIDPAVAAGLLRDAWLARSHDEPTVQLLRRLRFAGIDVDLSALAGDAAAAARGIDEIDLEPHLPYAVRRVLEERAPAAIGVPSGRTAKLTYEEDGSVSASVKLQELFGLAASPAIGPARVPVTFHLLAPNGRPVQTTRDLRSFWERTYPDVRKELRGRYPRHPWPDDPWTAQPTHRTTRRR
jgi:ATP-dependent helicase HrpB